MSLWNIQENSGIFLFKNMVKLSKLTQHGEIKKNMVKLKKHGEIKQSYKIFIQFYESFSNFS